MAASGSAASMCAPLFRRTGPPTRGTAAFLPAPHGAPGRCGSGVRTCCARSCGRACWMWRPTSSPASTALPPAISTGRTRSSWAFRPTRPSSASSTCTAEPGWPGPPWSSTAIAWTRRSRTTSPSTARPTTRGSLTLTRSAPGRPATPACSPACRTPTAGGGSSGTTAGLPCTASTGWWRKKDGTWTPWTAPWTRSASACGRRSRRRSGPWRR